MSTTEVIDGTLTALQQLPTYLEQGSAWVLAHAWVVIMISVIAAACISAAGRVLAHGLLADRAVLEFLPTTGFDPKPEEVVRFAHQVARCQKSVSRWLFSPARGTAIRIRFTSVGGPLVMRVEGPSRALGVLRHQGYAQCELRLVDEDLPDQERPDIHLGDPSRSPGPASRA